MTAYCWQDVYSQQLLEAVKHYTLSLKPHYSFTLLRQCCTLKSGTKNFQDYHTRCIFETERKEGKEIMKNHHITAR